MSKRTASLRDRFASVGAAEAKPPVTTPPPAARPPSKVVRYTLPLDSEARDELDQAADVLAREIPRGADGKPVASTHIVRALIMLYLSDEKVRAEVADLVKVARAGGR